MFQDAALACWWVRAPREMEFRAVLKTKPWFFTHRGSVFNERLEASAVDGETSTSRNVPFYDGPSNLLIIHLYGRCPLRRDRGPRFVRKPFLHEGMRSGQYHGTAW